MLIAQCDAFIFLDSVQFTRRDWRTRNVIRTRSGLHRLSIPVRQKGNYLAPIDAIEIADPDWSRHHWLTLKGAYQRAEAFEAEGAFLADAYRAIESECKLSSINRSLTRTLCDRLGIETQLLCDIDLVPRGHLAALDPTERLVELARAAGASEYLSGPSARSYLDEGRFERAGMSVQWMDYSACLIPYHQLGEGFEPSVSVIDAICNIGSETTGRLIRQDAVAAQTEA